MQVLAGRDVPGGATGAGQCENIQGAYSYGLYGCGLYSYALYSYGLIAMALYSYGPI